MMTSARDPLNYLIWHHHKKVFYGILAFQGEKSFNLTGTSELAQNLLTPIKFLAETFQLVSQLSETFAGNSAKGHQIKRFALGSVIVMS